MRGIPVAAALMLPALAFAGAPTVAVKPRSVLLGSGAVVELSVSGDGGEIRGFTSLGTLEHGAQVGPSATFRYRPPDIRHPATAVLLFWTRAARANDVTLVRVPLIGRTELKVNTEPRASVTVELHDRRFGPVIADRRGRASVPIEVPPHVRSARVHVDAGGQKSTRQTPIDVPDTNPLAAAFAADAFAADEEGTLIVAHEGGVDDGLAVKAVGATARVKDRGREIVIYSVRAEPRRDDVTVTLSSSSWSVDARSAVRPAGAPPPAPDPAIALWPFAAVGAFAAGGANFGPVFILGAGRTIVPNLTVELESGLRTAGFSANVEGLGTLESRVWGVPLLVGARVRLLQLGAAAVDGRIGVGVQLFSHGLRSDFQPDLAEAGLRPDGFIGVNASVKVGAFEPFAELRGQWGLVTTSTVDARLGGVLLSAGARYAWR